MSTVTPNEPDRKDVEVLEPGTGDIPAGRQNGGSGSSGGGGGGSSTRSPGTGDGAAGPGIPTVTIDPDAVPLANLPDMGNDDILALIYDEDVPLARLDSSYTYTLTLNRGQIDKKTSIDMSQLVPAGGFDNFSIHFSCEEDKPVVVRLECEFLFDNGESIRSDDCVFVLGYLSPDSQATQRPLSDYESERIFEDYNSLKKIETYKCNYVSDSFLDILDDYRQVVGEMED